MTTRKLWRLVMFGVFLALTSAMGAFAQTPVGGVYGGEGGEVQEEVAGGAAAGTLPFTGLDLLLMTLAAGLLLLTGLTIRRLARAKNVASR